jgi:chemotaxis protein MotB
MHITRLQNAIKVTVNSELPFPSGGWQMPTEARQTISKIVLILTPCSKPRCR